MELAKKREKCTTGCELLDSALEGGILCGAITELVGESTAGKTQLALQLLIAAQLPAALGGLNGAAFYIPTEGYFPSRRLRQLASSFQASRNLSFDPNKNVFVEPAESLQDMFKLLERLERLLSQQQQQQQQETMMPVRLIVIDSVAALFRTEFENNRSEMVVRARVLFQLAGRLLKLAHRHNLAVVVTNQVMDVVDGSSGVQIGSLSELVSSGRKVAPALGLSWSHCINIRIFLSRAERVSSGVLDGSSKRQRLDGGEDVVAERVTKRMLHVVFAPHLPYRSCGFFVNESGVHGELSG